MLTILHRHRATAWTALPVLIAATLVLGGCATGDAPQPTAATGATTPVGGVEGSADPTAQAGDQTGDQTGGQDGGQDGAGAAAGSPDTGSQDGAGGQGDGKPSGEGAPPDMAQGGPKTVVITVRGKNINPKPGKVDVKKGEPVLLVVITDSDNEVHVHGADIEKATKKATPTQIPLTFRQKGTFEVELHHPELLLTKFVVS